MTVLSFGEGQAHLTSGSRPDSELGYTELRLPYQASPVNFSKDQHLGT